MSNTNIPKWVSNSRMREQMINQIDAGIHLIYIDPKSKEVSRPKQTKMKEGNKNA